MSKKTKIIATMGPSVNTEEKIIKMYDNGVNIIRFNFSHADHDEAKQTIDLIKSLNNKGKTNLSILLDTKGPEIRTGDVKEKIKYIKGEEFNIYIDKDRVKNNGLFCDYKSLIKDVDLGGKIVLDSGLLEVKVLEKNKNHIKVEALNNALIGSRRHVNLPGVKLDLPGVTKKDEQDILFGIENNIDFIAASFIRNKENLKEIRNFLKKHDAKNCKIISKVENQEAIDNLDDIIEYSDGIMVARGDLGIEVPIEKLAVYQREMIKKCRQQGKFVITATHFLESMIENPFPTRAETSDVFNSVMQHSDSLMLSGESAIGKFPIESISIMNKIIIEAEKVVSYKLKDYSNDGLKDRDIEKKLLIRSGLFIAQELNAKAIIILTKSGLLARLTSSFKPSTPVYAFTNKKKSVGYMNVLFGIIPQFLESWEKGNYAKNLEDAISLLKKQKYIKAGNQIIAINDIQKDGDEIPVMEIIKIK